MFTVPPRLRVESFCQRQERDGGVFLLFYFCFRVPVAKITQIFFFSFRCFLNHVAFKRTARDLKASCSFAYNL